MCGRASLTKNEKEIEARFQSTFYTEDLERYNPLPSYNIAPTHYHPIIGLDDSAHFHFMRWGLIPSWAKDMKIGPMLINARIETILEKPAFRTAIESRRCLVPLDGFYEWRHISKKEKIPFRVCLRQGDLFSVAGLYDRWKNDKGEDIYSFTIITQEPNELMATIHDRMPAILTPELEQQWLDPSLNKSEAIKLLQPIASDALRAYRVSNDISKANANHAALINEIKAPNTLF